MTKSIDLKKANSYLSRKDPVLKEIISKIDLKIEKKEVNYFLSLVESIVSQQLSVKAADTIYARFVILFDKGIITPQNVLAKDKEQMRSVGISYQKISYIKDLAEKVIESKEIFEKIDQLSDEDVIVELTKVKGIGRWTAEMFLMFTLNRPDVFSHGDLGLRNAIQKLYNLDNRPTVEEAEEISSIWSPYRTIACRYLWKSLDV